MQSNSHFFPGYTFFVPTDKAFKEIGLSNKPDYYLSKGEGLKLLLNHFIPMRLYNRDFIDGQQFKTLGGKTIHVKNVNGNVTINDASIVESEVFVYNLGTMYYIDRVLFVTKDDLPITTETENPETESSTSWTTGLPEDVEHVPSELAEETGNFPDILLEPDNDATSEEIDLVVSTPQNIEERTEDKLETFVPTKYNTEYDSHTLKESLSTEAPGIVNSSTGTGSPNPNPPQK